MSSTNNNIYFDRNIQELIYYTAKDFFRTGLEKMEILKTPINPYNPVHIYKLPVPFTNISFAIELILKSFLKTQINTHSLLNLYNLIDRPIQIEIENNFENIRYNFLYIALGDGKPESSDGGNTHELIIEALARNEDPFVEFRYLYEKDWNRLTHFDSACMARLCHSALKVKAKKLNINIDL